MANFQKWRGEDNTEIREFVLRDYLNEYRSERQAILDAIVHDLTDFAIAQGYSDAQIQGALEDFFGTFASPMFVYFQVGGTTLADAIAADATLGWLNLDAAGITIRQRLINRLS